MTAKEMKEKETDVLEQELTAQTKHANYVKYLKRRSVLHAHDEKIEAR